MPQPSEETLKIASRRPSAEEVKAAIALAHLPEGSKDVQYYDGDAMAFPRAAMRRIKCCGCGLVHIVNMAQVLEEDVILTFTRDE